MLFEGFRYLFAHWDSQASNVVIAILETILLMLMSFATGFLQLYLAMSLGHLFNKSRVALSVVAFIAINAVMTTLLSVLPDISLHIAPGHSMSAYHQAVWLAIATELVISAVYFAGTEFILRKKLNLE